MCFRRRRPQPPDADAQPGLGGRGQVLLALAATTWGVILGLGIPWVFSWDDPPSVEEQLAEIRAEMADANRSAVISKAIDFEGPDRRAHLLVFRHNSLRPGDRRGPRPVSDELRIYSEGFDEDLDLVVRLAPTSDVSGLSEEPVPSNPMYTFKLLTIRDLDRNGRPELIGSINQLGMVDTRPFPIAIAWDDETSSYRVYPLVTQRPDLLKVRHPGYYARGLAREYTTRAAIDDRYSDTVFRGYAVEGYALARPRTYFGGHPALVVARVARGRCHACPITLAVQMLQLDLQGPRPRAFPCAALSTQEQVELGEAPSPGDLYNELLPRRYAAGFFAEPDTSRALEEARPWLEKSFTC